MKVEIYRITESHSELEVTHKDHRVHLLTEWPVEGLSPQPC